jgi:RNA polymerase sigma factor (sigma-70 family)
MATDQLSSVLQGLRRAALRRDGGGLSDGELLECFVKGRSEAAFEALVRRHGSMVLSVCRRVLRHAQDAEDAFQATFLVLARKAAVVVPRELVGNWLYGVAYRTALEARKAAARRRARERQVADMPEPYAPADGAPDDWRPVLDEELSRLSDKYRAVVVLCELEGRPRKEVAARLGIPEGTLSSRLAAARRLLARRLARRGLTLGAASLVAALGADTASAGVPARLTVATVKAAALSAVGGAPSAAAPADVLALAEGVLKAMLLHKLKVTAALLLALAVLGAGAGFLAGSRLGAEPAADRPARAEAPPAKDAAPEKSGDDEFTKLYALPDGAVLKRVAPPFADARLAYYRKHHASQATAIPEGPTNMFFRWKDGKLSNWGMSFGGSASSVPTIAEVLAGIYPQDIDGDGALLEEPVPGDFIVREGAPAEKVVARLDEILRKECALPVKLTLREVERDVFVVKGRWKSAPVEGRKENEVELYGKQLVPNSGAGGGTDDFAGFLKAAGSFMGRRLVSEVEAPPRGKVSWYNNLRSPFTAEQRLEDTDPERVLKHLTEQTGLTFKEDRRKVRILFVERAETKP